MTVDRRAYTERTALAWNRSGLALAILGALSLRTAERTDQPALGEALAALLFTAAAWVWLYGERLYRQRAAAGGRVTEERTRALGLIAAVTVLVAPASLALALVG